MKIYVFTFALTPIHLIINASIRAIYTCCGLSEITATAIVNEQGIDTLEEIRFLKDSEIDSLCKVVRRPVGTVAGIGAGPNVTNPGTPVPLHAKNTLKLAAYWLRQQEKFSRDVVPPML